MEIKLLKMMFNHAPSVFSTEKNNYKGIDLIEKKKAGHYCCYNKAGELMFSVKSSTIIVTHYVGEELAAYRNRKNLGSGWYKS